MWGVLAGPKIYFDPRTKQPKFLSNGVRYPPNPHGMDVFTFGQPIDQFFFEALDVSHGYAFRPNSSSFN